MHVAAKSQLLTHVGGSGDIHVADTIVFRCEVGDVYYAAAGVGARGFAVLGGQVNAGLSRSSVRRARVRHRLAANTSAITGFMTASLTVQRYILQR